MNLRTPSASSVHRPWAVWLSLWVLVLAALAPTVTHALDTLRAPSAGDLCSATQFVAADGAVAPTGASHGHCPLCVLSAERNLLPLVPAGQTSTDSGGHVHERALRPDCAGVAASVVGGAPPRGPPAKP